MANDSAAGSHGEPTEATRTFGRPEETPTEAGAEPTVGRAGGAAVTFAPVAESGADPHKHKAKVARPTRKARLRIAHVDPWSVMKTSFMFSVAAGIIFFVAVWAMWGVIDASGVLSKMQEAITALIGSSDGTSSVQITNYVNQWRVLGFAALVSVVDIVLLTALCTLLSFLYNLAAHLIGGLEVTLAED